MNGEILLKVSNLKVDFPITRGLFKRVVGAVKALDQIDFTLKKGKVLGIVGETGSGKTTLARAILRLILPTSGSVEFAGQNVAHLQGAALKQFRRDAQIIFQNPYTSLNPRKRIVDIIAEGPKFHGLVTTPAEQEALVAETLRQVGLPPEMLLLYPHQVSGGQLQRICIGRAIALRPQMIICDEAVSSLDVSVQAQILNLLQELKDTLGLSYLFISHDLSIVKYLSDDVLVLHLGKVVEQGETEEVFRRPKADYTKELLASIPPREPKLRQ